MHDNGILGKIPGDELAQAIKLLPEPGPGQPDRLQVETYSARWNIAIRVTYRLGKNPRRSFTNWYWTPCHAEAIGESPTADRVVAG